ncbi:hypothetical protein BD289DRAFT_456750 [Coniella lustricola]|uniref:2EXR domain-containing protein n=1 Tax=Coniella lustricola TaxID=2025994 RepID=A0A2T2ZUN8_9PEZI|nr:hypothetical protein BD289DRAFT_456750 [Coniella lustricola]
MTTATFDPFARLPKELRLSIWELAVPRERLIKLTIHRSHGRRHALATDPPRWLTRNALNKPVTGSPDRYCAVVHASPSSAAASAAASASASSLDGNSGSTQHAKPKLHSKFLRVSSESRAVALAFYRVHIPVYLTGPTRTDAHVPLLFNPEHDVLHLTAEAPVQETLVDFLWDLRAYDPRHVGLQRVAIDLDGLVCNDWRLLKPTDLLLVRQRAIVEETMRALREVWFVFEDRPRARRRCRRHGCGGAGAGAGAAGAGVGRFNATQTFSEARNVTQMPLASSTPTFEQRGLDARPGVDEALEHVYMGQVDPRELIFRWRKLENTWRGRQDERQDQAATEYRIAVSRIPPKVDNGSRVGNGTVTAGELRQALRSLSLQGSRRDGGGGGGDDDVDGNHDEERAGAPVSGFWLFPTEAVGEIDEGNPGEDLKLSEMPFRPGRIMDLRAFRPTLALSG